MAADEDEPATWQDDTVNGTAAEGGAFFSPHWPVVGVLRGEHGQPVLIPPVYGKIL